MYRYSGIGESYPDVDLDDMDFDLSFDLNFDGEGDLYYNYSYYAPSEGEGEGAAARKEQLAAAVSRRLNILMFHNAETKKLLQSNKYYNRILTSQRVVREQVRDFIGNTMSVCQSTFDLMGFQRGF